MKKIIKDIYEQLIQKIDKDVQVYSNIDKLYNASKAIRIAEIAKNISNTKLSFVEADGLKEIAKKAYTTALHKLNNDLTSNPTALDSEGVLEDIKKLAALPPAYGIDISKVEKVTKAAYVATVQAQLDIAKLQEDNVSKAPHTRLMAKYAQEALGAANKAAAIAKQAATNKGLGNLDLSQAVQQAYAAAASAEREIGKYQEGQVSVAKKDYPDMLMPKQHWEQLRGLRLLLNK